MIIRCLYDKLVPILELKKKFHPKNRNKHPDDQIQRLAEILKYQGIRYPAKISNQSDCITSGHGRILAAEYNGWTEFPVNYQGYDNPDMEYADVQADNAIAAWSELDLSLINTDVANLMPDFDIKMLGMKDFKVEPIDKLEPQCDEDEVPEVKESFVKLGDIWQLGRHRLMCGDSTSIDAVEKLMNGEKAEFVFTDPPYGVGFKYNNHNDEGGDKYADTMREIWHILSMMDCPIVLTPGNNNVGLWFGFADFKMACWVKKNAMSPASIAHLNVFEILLCYGVKQRRSTDLFEYPVNYKQQDTGDHPCPKLLKIVEDAIESWAPGCALLFEPFGGSGSTLIACEKTNRKCYMMELDPHYCAVIVERWQKYTGNKAERIIDGQAS